MLLDYRNDLQITEENIRNDKIEVQITGYEFRGDLSDYLEFTRLLASPSIQGENDPEQGWIFNNREFVRSANDYIMIRTSRERCHIPSPLFGGRVDFLGYQDKRIVISLQFNPTRLFEYQSVVDRGDRGYHFDLDQPFQLRREPPLFNGRRHRRAPVEFPLDGNDNVIIGAAILEFCTRGVWVRFLRSSFGRVLDCILAEFRRAVGVVNDRGRGVGSNARIVVAENLEYNLKSVESYFEVRPQPHHSNAIELVEDLKPMITSWASSIVNEYPVTPVMDLEGMSPSISLTHRRERTIKVYAKTNNRVRFELMQKGDGLVGARTTNSRTELIEKILNQTETAVDDLNRLLRWISEESSAAGRISVNPHRLILAIFSHSVSPHAASVIVTHLIHNRTINPHVSKPVQRSVTALRRQGILRVTNSGGRRSTASYTVSTNYRASLEALIGLRTSLSSSDRS